MKPKLLGLTLEELKEICLQEGLPGFTAKQICQWLYQKRAVSFSAMTNLSLKTRQLLEEKYQIGAVPYFKYALSKDGTRKYLFDFNGNFIEAVMIPDGDRKTLCVSSQAGCRMGCRFCMTGRQGFHGNLDAAQILSQFFLIDEAEDLSNAVFMGMGEPFDNLDNVLRAIEVLTSDWGCAWSPKRITVSSIGVNKAVKGQEKSPLERFLDESRAHLAISLHNPFHEERLTMMPAEKANDTRELLELLSKQDWSHQRRLSFEYIVFGGLNDSERHAKELVRLLSPIECRVNLIRFHEIPDTPYKGA